MGVVLKHHKVLAIVQQVWKLPEPLPKNADAAAIRAHEEQVTAFEDGDTKAMMILVNSLDDFHVNLTDGLDTAVAVWTKLTSVYEQSSSQRLDRTLEQFFTSRMSEGEDLVQYISRLHMIFREVNEELTKHEANELPDLVLMSRIVSTLPKEFFEFKNVWDNIPIKDRSVDLLTERVRLIETRLDSATPSSRGEALHAARVTQNADRKKSQKKLKCFICKGPHFANQCPKNSKKKGPSKPKDSNGDGRGEQANTGFLCYVTSTESKDNFIADSGASQHMSFRKDYFQTYEPFDVPVLVTVGNGENIEALGQGDIRVQVKVGRRRDITFIRKVWYVPNLGRNLLSVSRTVEKGYSFTVKNNKCVFMKNGKPEMFGHVNNGLFELEMEVLPSTADAFVNSGKKQKTLKEWHESLAHQNKAHVKKFLKRHEIDFLGSDLFCEACVLGKQHRDTYHSRTVKPTQPGEIISGDVCGPMENESLGGKRYALVFKDYFTKFRRVFFLAKKSEVASHLETFLNECQTAGHVVKTFMSDNGGEFVNSTVKELLRQRGITHRCTMAFTPEENGSIEREMRTLVEAARTMLFANEDLPKRLWAEAMNTACHVINRTGPTSDGKTPYELWYNRGSAPVEHFRPFGSPCFVHVPKQKRSKWSKKSNPGKLVGYCDERDGFRVYDGTKVVTSRDVVFRPYDEGNNGAEGTVNKVKSVPINIPGPRPVSLLDLRSNHDESDDDVFQDTDGGQSDDGQVNDGQVSDDQSSPDGADGGRPQRQRRPPAYLNDYVTLAEAGPTYGEAVKSSDWWHWQSAMNEEMKSLEENKVFELVTLPKNKRAIGVKWVLVKKNRPERYKARLVAKGFAQEYGVDYFETFSPVARFDTVRCLVNVAVQENLHLKQFDVKTAFLYSNLDEEIYVRQPEGYDDNSGRVWKLRRSLYGLKQSPRCWNQKLMKNMLEQGFVQSTADPCLYIRNRNGEKLLVVVFVDDGLIAGSNEQEVAEFIEHLEKQFKLKVTEPDCYLGVEINRTEKSIALNQKSYILSVLDRYRMADSHPVGTPMSVRGDGSVSDSKPLASGVPYREAVGSLLYITNTRPDISCSVSLVAQKVNAPTTEDWADVKRIMRYLKGTVDYSLVYEKNEKILHCYSDADYARDEETRQSRTGYLCLFAGGLVSWASMKQNCVTLSTTEAEFLAASEAAKQIVWLKNLLSEIYEQGVDALLYVDNAGAIRLAKNAGEFHKRSKHIHVRYQFVRQEFQKGTYDIRHVPGDDQLADFLTKRMPVSRLKCLLERSSLRAN